MQKVINRARTLRRTSTDVEKKLWYHLRDRQLLGYKFRRQHPVGPYILDFACEASMLAVELDGGQHADAPHHARDAARTALLEKSGWQVVRFWNNDVNENIEGVLQTIASALTRKC